ncbi:RagB/SusD family nutrient uptake outer membrane protein [Bacteroides nordii]|uniref:RagB/SusD family nutrient uptake outer membrane protein n=1 Tax=Bacteroides nordii TaxID=291645 RepID=UPI002A8019F9|nr:RagB/SusD family nutrient uptake outer membrane protein [Bacteroides nordii]
MKTIRTMILWGGLAALTVGCEDLKFGNNFLEKPMSDEVSIDTVFSQKRYADQALNQFYKSLPDYAPSSQGYHYESLILDVFSDIGYTSRLSWNHGSITAANKGSAFPYQLSNNDVMGDPTFGIRKAYIYIENVDRVPDMSGEEKKLRKAEAKVVIAYHYMDMIRYYGGVPWIDHAYSADEIFEFPRLTLEETVEKTVGLLDEAAKDLPWFTTDEEYGHMTAAVAKALKFRLLIFVASPLFNNVVPYYEGQAATGHLSWLGDYQESRWTAALEAGREFLRLNKQNEDYYRVENTGNPREDYINGYFTKGNREVVMASFRWGTYDKRNKGFRMYDQGYGMPRASYADMFLWKDGSRFDWNNPEHRAHPFFDASGNPTRDIRLYENLVVNGDKWQGRKAEVYTGGREGFGTGSSVGQKTQFGYGFRKFLRDKHNEMHNKPYSCPLIRMPEIYLGMAEVMNQLGQASVKDEFGMDAYDYLNLVHTRAGLPEVTNGEVLSGEPFLNYLLDERAREFGQEDMRYHDMRRYRKGAEWATRPVEELVTTKSGSDFNYQVNVRNEKYLWYDHWYLLPFPVAEINKKYGLIQNPGWE